MIYITTNHGTGDTYMTLAFAKAVERVRGKPVTVLVPQQHEAIAAMFPDVKTEYSTGIIPNLGTDGELIVAHPSSVPKRVRIDHLCLLARRLTHADLWRAMLELPPDEPMPQGAPQAIALYPTTMAKRVLLIPEARSIPNSLPDFWLLLQHKLLERGMEVVVNHPHWSLRELFQECLRAEWVIGPQCGTMMILCHAGFPCRKTFATPSVDGHEYFKRTWPYLSVKTFSGDNYDDVEEVKLTANLERGLSEVLSGRHALGLPVNHGRCVDMFGIASVGEFLDKFSILELKVKHLPPEKKALVMREYLECREIAEEISRRFGVLMLDAWRELQRVNEEAWHANDVAVRAAMNGGADAEHYTNAVRLNQRRMLLRDLINDVCGTKAREVKSYYD